MSLSSEASKEKQKQQEEQNKQAAKNMAQLMRCVAVAASSPEGVVAFRQIMNMCSYNKNVVVGTAESGIDGVGTVYNAGRENIWKELRQLIPNKTRKIIEYEKTIFSEDE